MKHLLFNSETKMFEGKIRKKSKKPIKVEGSKSSDKSENKLWQKSQK